MRRTWPAALLLMALALLGAGCGGGGDDGSSTAKPRLVVSAAASLKEAFTQYGKEFAEGDAKFSFAGSDVLAAQIRSGVKPDVYAAANTTLPDALLNEGLLDGMPVRFASNELVLAVPAGSKRVRRIGDLTRKGVRIAIGSGTVPVGTYTQRVFERLPPATRRAIHANVRTEEPDVTGIVGKLTQGAVDAGFLYVTDVRATNGKLRSIHLPAYLAPVVQYSVAIVKGARQPEAAKAFIYELLTGKGRDALKAAGFGPAPSDAG